MAGPRAAGGDTGGICKARQWAVNRSGLNRSCTIAPGPRSTPPVRQQSVSDERLRPVFRPLLPRPVDLAGANLRQNLAGCPPARSPCRRKARRPRPPRCPSNTVGSVVGLRRPPANPAARRASSRQPGQVDDSECCSRVDRLMLNDASACPLGVGAQGRHERGADIVHHWTRGRHAVGRCFSKMARPVAIDHAGRRGFFPQPRDSKRVHRACP